MKETLEVIILFHLVLYVSLEYSISIKASFQINLILCYMSFLMKLTDVSDALVRIIS